MVAIESTPEMATAVYATMARNLAGVTVDDATQALCLRLKEFALLGRTASRKNEMLQVQGRRLRSCRRGSMSSISRKCRGKSARRTIRSAISSASPADRADMSSI